MEEARDLVQLTISLYTLDHGFFGQQQMKLGKSVAACKKRGWGIV